MAARRKIDEDAVLRAVVEGTVSDTGSDFYRALVANLARALETNGAWVTEYDPATEQLRALAFYMGGKFIEDYVYVLPGTPCETAITEGRLVHIPDRVVDLYPDAPKDPLFSGTVSYLGVPMFDDRHRLLGHVAVVDTIHRCPGQSIERHETRRRDGDARYAGSSGRCGGIGHIQLLGVDPGAAAF